MTIPAHIQKAMLNNQPDVVMPWMKAIDDTDQKTLFGVFNMLRALEGDAFDMVVSIRQHFLDRWKEQYGASRPPVAIQNTLEEHFFSIIATCRDDPSWLPWIITPLHRNTDARTLSDIFRHALDFQKLDTFDALWSIAISVPEHAQYLGEIDAFSPLQYLLRRAMGHPEFLDRLHHNIQSDLSAETQLFALRILAHAAFEDGHKNNVLSWVMENGFPMSEMEEVAQHTHLGLDRASIRSHEWMWTTRQQYRWQKCEPVHAKEFILTSMIDMCSPSNASRFSSDQWQSAKRLWSEMFTQTLNQDTAALREMITVALNIGYDDIHWMLDCARPDQIKELLDDDWEPLHAHPQWRHHPQVQAAVLHQQVEPAAAPQRAPRKL